MATYQITAPDGGVYEITAPDDATEQEVLAYAQQNYSPTPQQQQTPAVLPDVAKSLGAGAVEGLAAAPALPLSIGAWAGGKLAENLVGKAGQDVDTTSGLGKLAYDYLGKIYGQGGLAENLPSGFLDTANKLGELIHTPQTTGGEYAKTIGAFSSGMVPFAKGATALQSLGQALKQGAVAGIGSETAGQLAEGTEYEPWARLAGAITPSALNSLASQTIVPIGQKIGKTIGEYKSLQTQAGQELQAGEFLRAIAGEAGITPKPLPIKGIDVDLGVATQNPNLVSVRKALSTMDAAPFAEQANAINRAIVGAVDEVSPPSLRTDTASQSMINTLESNMKALENQSNKLYNKIDKELLMPSSFLKEEAATFLQGLTKAESKSIPSINRYIKIINDEFGDLTPFGELKSLYSTVGNELRTAEKAQDFNKARLLAGLKGVIKKHMPDGEDAAGGVLAHFDEKAAAYNKPIDTARRNVAAKEATMNTLLARQATDNSVYRPNANDIRKAQDDIDAAKSELNSLVEGQSGLENTRRQLIENWQSNPQNLQAWSDANKFFRENIAPFRDKPIASRVGKNAGVSESVGGDYFWKTPENLKEYLSMAGANGAGKARQYALADFRETALKNGEFNANAAERWLYDNKLKNDILFPEQGVQKKIMDIIDTNRMVGLKAPTMKQSQLETQISGLTGGSLLSPTALTMLGTGLGGAAGATIGGGLGSTVVGVLGAAVGSQMGSKVTAGRENIIKLVQEGILDANKGMEMIAKAEALNSNRLSNVLTANRRNDYFRRPTQIAGEWLATGTSKKEKGSSLVKLLHQLEKYGTLSGQSQLSQTQ